MASVSGSTARQTPASLAQAPQASTAAEGGTSDVAPPDADKPTRTQGYCSAAWPMRTTPRFNADPAGESLYCIKGSADLLAVTMDANL